MNDKYDLSEHRVTGEEVFSGKLLRVHRDVVRLPDGQEAVREYVQHPGAVLIVPLFGDRSVLLERQFRYPQRREFIELPAGKLEPGEPKLETAKRELLEETGYVAAEWRRLTTLHPSVGYSDEAIELYLAGRLEYRGASLDEGEFLEVLTLPLAEAVAMVGDGRITDGKTIAGLLWIDAFLK